MSSIEEKGKHQMSVQDVTTVIGHYTTQDELPRLSRKSGILEFERSKEIISRYLTSPAMAVADIGGGPGIYSLWLAGLGHNVSLVDLVPRHVEAALQQCGDLGLQLESAQVGDARRTGLGSGAYDMVLLMGPLYHLQEREQRLSAMRETRRLLKPGGVVLAAAISRFASLMAGYQLGMMDDPEYCAIVDQDLLDGVHENPTEKDYFTDAYFHLGEELEKEMVESGFSQVKTVGVEGFMWLVDPDSKQCLGEPSRSRLLDYLARIETERSMIGTSAHLLCIGQV